MSVKGEIVEIPISEIYFSKDLRELAAAAKRSAVQKLKSVLQARFPEGRNELFNSMRIYYPQYWRDENDSRILGLRCILERFSAPLSAAGITELRRFRTLATHHFNDISKSLKNKGLEFPNLCLKTELRSCITGSNSRAFRVWTLILRDRRLTMHISTMQDLMLMKANDNTRFESERKGIISRAMEMYLKKRRKVQLSSSK